MQSPNFRNNNKIHHDSFELFAPVDNNHHHHQNTTTNMSIGAGAGASVHSSVSSNSCNSHTRILDHPGLKPFDSNSTGHSAIHATSGGGRPSSYSSSSSSNDDVLARMLMDPNCPTIPLGSYYDGAWAINLKKLHVGAAFAQGAFGKLYRGSYNGEDVAIKLLVKPEGDPGRARLMEQQFGQEVMMLAGLRHRNIVTFVGACRKDTVWCIVTEYARGGSVRQALAGRSSGRAVPVRTAVKQALDVARGMEYVHGLGFIHRDLKSDNLLIFGDKSIKIADFGVARIEVKTEGMTPETGTYRWMAP